MDTDPPSVQAAVATPPAPSPPSSVCDDTSRLQRRQALALRGPTRSVWLPVWEGPERTTDCTILGRKPVAGIRTTSLGLADDMRVSKEHAILLCDSRTGRWRVENLKPNPIFIQRGFDTNASAEPERLHAGGPAAEIAVGDAICFAVVDEAHRLLVIPRESVRTRAAESDPEAPPAPKRARSSVSSPGQALVAQKQPQPGSAAGDRTPNMSVPAEAGGSSLPGSTGTGTGVERRRRKVAVELSDRPETRLEGETGPGLSSAAAPQAAFATCVITFVERGMGEKQLQVFKKQVQHAGGRWSSDRLALDSEGNVCTTHIVAKSWQRAAEAVGEALIGPSGLPVANADWMVQAIKDSKSARDLCKVTGKYRLLPSENGSSWDVGVEQETATLRSRVPYSAGNFQGTHYRATSLAESRQVEDSQDSQRQSQSVGDEASEGRPAAATAAVALSAETEDKVPLLIKLFEELQDLTEADESKNNHWRVRNYQKMVNCLKKYHAYGWPPLWRSGDFTRAIDDIKEDRMPGCPLFVVKDCTETLKKAEEVLRTGTMARIEAFRQDPRMNALRSLAQVWGVGLKQASDLYAAGFSTLQSLRTPEGQRRLNRVQKLGLKYHEDLALRIPRDEITAMVGLIKKTAEELVGPDKSAGLRVEGVGSYRRNKPTSGDIDVLISHTDGMTHVKLLELVVESLTASGFLREKLTDTTASSKKTAEDELSKNKHTHTKQPNGGKYMGIALFDPAAHCAPEVLASSTLRPRHRHIDIFT